MIMKDNKIPISIAIVCFNEEDNIERCLKSVSWADEIVIVDSFSTDKTVDICKKYTDRVVQREWPGFRDQKLYAISLATHEWILSIDSDEEVSDELASEIQERLAKDLNAYDGYIMKRHTFFLGRWINHSGWYPDRKLRLFKKQCFTISDGNLHEKFIVKGKTFKLNGELYHYTYKNISHQLKTIDGFTNIQTDEMIKNNETSFVVLKMLIKPPVNFFENYIYKLGILDGLAGLIICMLSAYSTFVKFAKLWEKSKHLSLNESRSEFSGLKD